MEWFVVFGMRPFWLVDLVGWLVGVTFWVNKNVQRKVGL